MWARSDGAPHNLCGDLWANNLKDSRTLIIYVRAVFTHWCVVFYLMLSWLDWDFAPMWRALLAEALPFDVSRLLFEGSWDNYIVARGDWRYVDVLLSSIFYEFLINFKPYLRSISLRSINSYTIYFRYYFLFCFQQRFYFWVYFPLDIVSMIFKLYLVWYIRLVSRANESALPNLYSYGVHVPPYRWYLL